MIHIIILGGIITHIGQQSTAMVGLVSAVFPKDNKRFIWQRLYLIMKILCLIMGILHITMIDATSAPTSSPTSSPSSTLTATAPAVDLASFITACKCDGLAANCEADPASLDAANNLNICIKSLDTDIELVSVTDLDINQAGGAGGAGLKAVMQDDSPSDVLITSYLDSTSTNIRVIETIVPDIYFYATNIGTALTVSGTVVVQLVGSRRRHLVKLEINDETQTDMRLCGLSSPPFAKPWYQFNSLNKANSAFVIPVALTNHDDHINTDSGHGEEKEELQLDLQLI